MSKRPISDHEVHGEKKARVVPNALLSSDIWRCIALLLDNLSKEALRSTCVRLSEYLTEKSVRSKEEFSHCSKYNALRSAVANRSLSQVEWVWNQWKSCSRLRRHFLRYESIPRTDGVIKFLVAGSHLHLLREIICKFHLPVEEDMRYTMCLYAANHLTLLEWLNSKRVLHMEAVWRETTRPDVLEWLVEKSFRHKRGNVLRRRIVQMIEEKALKLEHVDVLIWLLENMKNGLLLASDFKENIVKKINQNIDPQIVEVVFHFFPDWRSG